MENRRNVSFRNFAFEVKTIQKTPSSPLRGPKLVSVSFRKKSASPSRRYTRAISPLPVRTGTEESRRTIETLHKELEKLRRQI
ncbi:MAG: hypothetical protein V2I33_24865 [Kangiellaceae bacterium]|jgi:hypothetical protein|nr:hypothetical protein [Kangiellaceae bacterium]